MKRFMLDISACSTAGVPDWMHEQGYEALPVLAGPFPGYYEFDEKRLPLAALATLAAEKAAAGLRSDAPVYFTLDMCPKGAELHEVAA